MVKSNNDNTRNVHINLIQINPNNPRMIFDQEELDRLTESIKERDILVPLNVFLDENKKFTIIDGERRYKASLKLGLQTLPIIINKKPQQEEYVMDMFHIHNLLEPWELVPTALKLKEVSDVFKKKNGREPMERELNKMTGLTISEIRRCRLVLSLPKDIQDMLLNEEAKTSKEKSIVGKEKLVTEDFLIEITKNLINPLKDYNIKAAKELGDDKKLYESLIKKRRDGLIKNIVSLRPISKYIREHPNKAAKDVKEFLTNPSISSEDLIIKAGLEFNFYKFERNLKVFTGAINNIPQKLDDKQRDVIRKALKKVRNLIDKKLETLR